jgi:GTPase
MSDQEPPDASESPEAGAPSDGLDAMLAAAGISDVDPDTPDGFRSGFVSIVGRPNVGKSTLVNQLLGEKVSIVSDKPQTTRHQIRGVLHRPEAQLVLVDTPGIHKPRTLMGERLNETATGALADVDEACLVIDATAKLGPGDRFVAGRMPPGSVLVLNKIDRATPEQVMTQLAAAAEFDFAEYFPVSARTGEGVDALKDHLLDQLPEGPRWFPREQLSDVDDEVRVAELVREQLLAVTREELPHSIATRVTEWDWPRVRVEILVERESQKGIVIGRKGAVLKEVGTRARAQLPDGVYLELHVRVDKDWQSKAAVLERLGY